MTPMKALLAGVATLGAALFASASTLSPAPTSAATSGLAGPGGVIDAVQDYLKAVDQGDGDYLEQAFADVAPDGAYGFDETNQKLRQLKRRSGTFFDVTSSGRPITATSAKEFIRMIADEITGSSKAGQRLETKIRSIRADCPSGDCSYAVVEFDRIYTADSGQSRVVPMRASALVRFGKGEPHFKLFHWHASRTDDGARSAEASKGTR